MTVLQTIGCQGCRPYQVIVRLTAAGVRLPVDVRAPPQSREPGFSKRQPAASLDEHGMGDAHLRDLGTGRAATGQPVEHLAA